MTVDKSAMAPRAIGRKSNVAVVEKVAGELGVAWLVGRLRCGWLALRVVRSGVSTRVTT